MKKLFLLLLLSLGFTGLSFADDEDYDLDKAVSIPYVDCKPMLFFNNKVLTFPSAEMSQLLNDINPPGIELVKPGPFIEIDKPTELDIFP